MRSARVPVAGRAFPVRPRGAALFPRGGGRRSRKARPVVTRAEELKFFTETGLIARTVAEWGSRIRVAPVIS